MRESLLIITVIHVFYFSNAQHVGIGNTDPAYHLDLSGRMRIRGGANILLSAGIWLGGTGADSAVNKVLIGMQADSILGFYSNKSDVGWGLTFDGRNGNMGLKNSNPNFPISFQDVAGDKISLFRDLNGNYYGMGIGNSVMQLTTPHNTSDIVLGYGRSNNFTENMRIKGNGRVGIGTANPNATIEAKSNITGIPILRLSGVNEAYQDFYPLGNNGGRYGWLGFSASEPDKFFLFNDRNGDMSFITGGGERLTLKSNGHVGIGITDPAYKLDVGARMRIRSAPGMTAGLWLNNNANNASPAFIGMFSDNQVGFYGSGSAGWGLLMNTQTGAVSFGGNAGQPGQVLTSNGSGSSASWGSATSQLFNNMYQFGLPSGVNLSGSGTPYQFAGLNQNITLSKTSKVMVSMHVAGKNESVVGNSISEFQLYINSAPDAFVYKAVTTPPNTSFDEDSGFRMVTLVPGIYNFKMQVRTTTIGSVSYYNQDRGFGIRMIIIVIPE